MNGPLVKVDQLTKLFPVQKGMFRKPTEFIHAVDGISFEIAPGESVGLVGESGCGKSTTGRMLVKLMETTSGQIFMADEQDDLIDVAHRAMGPFGVAEVSFDQHVRMVGIDLME